MTPGAGPDLASYDVIVLQTSGGKDSQAMLTRIVELVDTAGLPRDLIIAVHADLGRVEWAGTRELAAAQAAAYGLRFETVARDEDLLDHVVTRRATLDAQGRTDAPAWPSSQARWCTSDHKTAQGAKVMTRLAAQHRAVHGKDSRIRILNCLGIRATESRQRASKAPFGHDASASNGRRHVDRWLPIHDWPERRVWQTIAASGLPYHPAYDLGMTRLSCVFCVLASWSDLVTAARHNRALALAYIDVEDRTGHTFRARESMRDVLAAADAAEAAGAAPGPAPDPEAAGLAARLGIPVPVARRVFLDAAPERPEQLCLAL